jgi:Bacterial Ig-like domain (group 2)/FG-GAP-like repeat
VQGHSNAPARRGNYNGHVSRWLIVSALCAILPACGGHGTSSSAPPPQIFATLITFPTGAVPPGFVSPGFNTSAAVQVLDNSGSAPIATGSVSINGTPLAYNAVNQEYEGNLTVDPGSGVALSVNLGGTTYTGSATQFTSYPVISAPSAGSRLSTSGANLVAWSGGAPTKNAAYALGVLDAADPTNQLVWPSGNALQVVSASTNSFSIDPNSLTVGSRLVIVGIATVVDIPSAASNSGIVISGFNYVPVTVTYGSTASLVSIAVTPQSPPMVKGTTQQFTAVGTYSDNSVLNLTTQVIWTSSDTSKATISATGLATGMDAGSATITATFAGIFDSTGVKVVPGFLPGVHYPGFPTTSSVGDTAVGDLNGDGRNDVAVLEQFGARILIYYQNAGGTFDPPQVITTDLNVTGIAIGDVNNDGLADLIVSGNSTTATSGFLGRIAVFRQDNVNHALGSPQEYILSTNNVGPLAVADLNGDSLPDVVSAGTGSGSNGVISLLFQGSGGVLGPEVTYTSVTVVVDGELHVADMNHDGSNDIVLQSANKELAVIRQVSPGTFSSTPDFYTVQTNYWPWFRSFALADLNGDGWVDVIVADLTGNLNIFYQDANGILTGPTIQSYAADEIKVADLDGDGLNDIILLIYGNWVRILYQSPNHSFQNPLFYTLPTQSSGGTFVHQALSVGDVTGDGLPDIVASWSNEGIFVLPRMP